MPVTTLLSLNSGSSSLKFGLFAVRDAEPRALCSGTAEEIGTGASRFWIRDAAGAQLREQRQPIAGQQEALAIFADAIRDLAFPAPAAVGHRVVHGGPNLRDHTEITQAVLRDLQAAIYFAPLHIPAALDMIQHAQRLFPKIPQFACLDTAFHRTLPESAARFPLPAKFWEAGVRRYGFHGLSCESILHELGAAIPPRMIVAHLGSGASLTAIANGRSVDTTMGLTPTGGIVMATRPGDLDPGLLLHLLRAVGNDSAKLEHLLDKESGLLGISGLSSDVRQLHDAAQNPLAQCALDIFCHSVKKAIGALFAVLGGLDLMVFTGGIGEHDAAVRLQICAGLDALGIALDLEANQRNLRQINNSASLVRVATIPSDEDTQIARHVYRLLLQNQFSRC